MLIKNIIQCLFSAGLLFNILLFIPQSLQIIRAKSAAGLSLLTFFGLLAIQFTVVLHGFSIHDYWLTSGYIASMLTCGSVIVLIVYYRRMRDTAKQAS